METAEITAENQPRSPAPEDAMVEKMLRGFVRALLSELEAQSGTQT
jgi:hypothetical protein